METLVSKALMIRLSLPPSPASETSAFNKIRAFSRRCAGLLPFRISVSSSERSPQLNRTTYFLTTISFAAMIASVARVATKAYHQILSTSLKRATRGADPDSLSEGHLHRSTGDFEEALIALLGKDAGGLSASTIGRLKEAWSDEHTRWSKRDLSAKRYVYFWVDGIHVQPRLEEAAQCLLVIIGATPEGKKELVGLIDGVRESAQSWKELLLDLKRRGLAMGPELAVADGAVGFWQAVEEVWPRTRGQRCWVHKTANVLNKLPKSQQSKAKRALQEIWMAETKKDALAAFDAFIETWGVKYDKAVECLIKDRDALLAFYDFPAEHWKHLRTTNPIESSFATVRHRTVRSKGCLSNKTALAMIFKLAEAAEKNWRRLDGHNQLPKIILGVKFTDGIEVVKPKAQAAAA